MQKIKILNPTLIVAALGYFVDIYDLVLFSIVRKPSLMALGLTAEQIEAKGLLLLNIQMIGMLIGGLAWGVLGDKKGRLKVLFGSILLYSLANIANAFVTNIEMYALLRFIAGIGLAGELGAGITLVSELLSKEQRGWGTTLVATVGVSGAILAGYLGTHPSIGWQWCFIIGGVLGLALLLLRIGVLESSLFNQGKSNHSNNGSLRLLFSHPIRLKKYIILVCIGLPIWYCIGILITLSPELGSALQLQGNVVGGKAIMYCYIGVTLGDLLSGLLSQYLQSRKRALQIFVVATMAMVFAYFQMQGQSVQNFYYLIIVLGFAAGYWAVLITSVAEQFGTNLRATATTSVPNFIRASLVPISLFYTALQTITEHKLQAAMITGVVCCGIAFAATCVIKETFNADLDFLES